MTAAVLLPLGGCDAASGRVDATNRDPDVGLTSAPAERGAAPAAWMPAAGEMLIFGGMEPITNDAWIDDLAARAWTPIAAD